MDKIKKLKEKLKTVTGKVKLETLNDLAFALYHTKPEKTEQYATQALSLAEELNSQMGIARSYNIIGISHHWRGDYSKALRFYLKALEIYENMGNDHKIAASKNNIGAIYEKQGNYDQALKFHLEAQKIWEEMNDKDNLSASYNNIGIIYEKQDSCDLALEYHLKSLHIKEETDDKLGSSISYNNIGIIYGKQGNLDLALEYHLKALKIKKEIGDNQTVAVSYINIGNIYSEQNDNDKAMGFYLKALKSFEDISDKYGITTSNTSIGIINTRLQDYDLAHEYLKKSLLSASEIGAKELETSALDALSKLHEIQSDFDQALKYHKKTTELTKEIFNEQKSKQIVEMQAKYETEEKEKVTEIFRLKNVELAQANDQLKIEIAERNNAETKLQKSNNQLKVVNSILRHDVINDLVVIKSAMNIFKKTSNAEMLDEIENRVMKSLDTIQRHQKQQSYIEKHSDLNEYKIENVINKTIEHYPDLKFNISGSCIVYADDTIFSVFDNLIGNSIKHGNTQKINIKINTKDEYCEIIFADFGIGIPDKVKEKIFDEGFAYGKTGNTGIGLYIAKQTIEEYGGTVLVEDNKPKGASFVIRLRKVIKRFE